LDDKLEWIKFSHAAWTNDGAGFYYARYPQPQPGEQFHELNLNQTVCYHKIGTPQSADEVVYRRADHPEGSFDVQVTDDGRYLIVTMRKADDEHFRVAYRDLSQPKSELVELIDHFDNQFYFVGNQGAKFFFVTDRDAPRRRLVEIDTRNPQ